MFESRVHRGMFVRGLEIFRIVYPQFYPLPNHPNLGVGPPYNYNNWTNLKFIFIHDTYGIFMEESDNDQALSK